VRVFHNSAYDMMDKLPPPSPLFTRRTRFVLVCLLGSLHWLVCAFAATAQKLYPLSDAGWLWYAVLGFVPAWLIALAGTLWAYWGDRTAPAGERTDPWAFVFSGVGVASALPWILPWLPLYFRDFID